MNATLELQCRQIGCGRSSMDKNIGRNGGVNITWWISNLPTPSSLETFINAFFMIGTDSPDNMLSFTITDPFSNKTSQGRIIFLRIWMTSPGTNRLELWDVTTVVETGFAFRRIVETWQTNFAIRCNFNWFRLWTKIHDARSMITSDYRASKSSAHKETSVMMMTAVAYWKYPSQSQSDTANIWKT